MNLNRNYLYLFPWGSIPWPALLSPLWLQRCRWISVWGGESPCVLQHKYFTYIVARKSIKIPWIFTSELSQDYQRSTFKGGNIQRSGWPTWGVSAKSEMFEFKIALMLIIFLPYKRVSGIADLDNHDVFANQVEDHLGQPIGMVAEDPRLVRTGPRTPV